MKKFIFSILSLIFFGTQLFAWNQTHSEVTYNGDVKHYIVCKNGEPKIVLESKSYNAFLGKNNAKYSSLKDAAKSYCNSISNIIKLKKGTIVFKYKSGEKGIESYLTSKTNYNLAKLSASMGDKNLIKLSANALVKLDTCYPLKKVIVDKYNNYKDADSNSLDKLEKGLYKKIFLIDSYCKIHDGNNNYYFIRKSNIN